MLERVLGERYELEEKIGSGGMAEVYRAHDKLLDRPVAVKILHEAYRSDAEFVEKFQREAKAAARLSHPNIVNIYDVGREGIDHYIVMEYVPGNSLKDKIREDGPLNILTATKIAKDIACGLAHAHANNLVHCDIKPHNILMTPDGHAKIADFGIARAVTSSTMTYGGNVIGSVHYFSPEQAQGGTITPKSDVYSLGIVMYEMLTNRLPFTGETAMAIAMKQVEEDPVPPISFRPQIPQMLEAIVLRAMNKNSEHRPSSFDMIQALSNIEANLSVAQLDDPDATKILPRVKVDVLPPRRNIRERITATKSKPAAPDRIFLQSKLFLLGLIFVLMAGFGLGILMAFGRFWDAEEVAVPNVAGKQLALARQILEDGRLRVNVSEVYDATVPAGQVVTQDPIAGRNVKLERLVTIYVSKGGETIDMPDLVGLNKSSAKERIRKLGLQLGAIYEKDSDREPGTILSHDPGLGTKINRGQVIDLVVSRGYSSVAVRPNRAEAAPAPTRTLAVEKTYVPDVQSASLDLAKTGVENRGLHVGSVTYQDSAQTEGTVISQNPLPAAYVDLGTSVDLVIARHVNPPADNPIIDKIYDASEIVAAPFESGDSR